MTDLEEQHVSIKFCFKLQTNAVKTLRANTSSFAQFSKLKGGVTSVTGVEHSGQPSRSRACDNVDQVKAPVQKHRKSLTKKLVTCWKLPMGEFQVFSKTI